jgi:hypothetical protein
MPPARIELAHTRKDADSPQAIGARGWFNGYGGMLSRRLAVATFAAGGIDKQIT